MIRRFVFDNLIYKVSQNRFMLLNLISFRRKLIDREQLDMLLEAEDNRNISKEVTKDRTFVDSLINEKQILTEDIQRVVFDTLEQEQLSDKWEHVVHSATINVTHACNFSCDYCYQNYYKKHDEYTKSMTKRHIDSINSFLRWRMS